MGVVEKGSHGMGLEIRGKVGAPSAYGSAGYGIFSYGAGAKNFGIYQIRSLDGKQIQVKMKYYHPTNPQTESQQANRQKYADGVTAWQGLTNEQKEVYNERAKHNKLSGYNLFLKEYLLSN